MKHEVIIMAAPNGARKTKVDHATLPVSIAETVAEAADCRAAGAAALHAHVRGDQEEHVLDAGRYRELLDELARQVPDMLVQVTSEAVGVYTPQQQIECIQTVRPEMVSMALKEISSNFSDEDSARRFFDWCDEASVHVQHIVFSAEELSHFLDYRERGIVPSQHRCVLFVLGRYRADFQSTPSDLGPFLEQDLSGLDWFVCAFGHQEQDCVMTAIEAGGHGRIGFENNLYLPDGSLAGSTAGLIASLGQRIEASGYRAASPGSARSLLGLRSA